MIALRGWLPFCQEIEEVAKQSPIRTDLVQKIQGILSPVTKESLIDGNRDPSNDLEAVLGSRVLYCHSRDDEIVPIQNGEKLCQVLKQLGMSVTTRSYTTGGHWLHEPEGVDDIAAFLQGYKLGEPAQDHEDCMAIRACLRFKEC